MFKFSSWERQLDSTFVKYDDEFLDTVIKLNAINAHN